MYNLDCLNNIIALTRTECPCYNFTPEQMVSESGVFLDEMDDLCNLLPLLYGVCKCGIEENNVAVLGLKAIENAKNAVLQDLMMCLSAQNKVDERFGNGITVGNDKETGFSKLSQDYTVIRHRLAGGRDIRYCLTHIGVHPVKVNGYLTETVKEVMIYDENGCDLLDDPLLLTTPLKGVSKIKLDQPIIIESEEGCDTYFYVVSVNDDAQPRKNYNRCKCPGKADPKYFSLWQAEGLQINSLSSEDDFMHLKNYGCSSKWSPMYGFCFTMEIGCNMGGVVCNHLSKNKNLALYTQLAKAIASKAAAQLLGEVIQCGSIDYKRFASLEDMEKVKNNYELLYKFYLQGDDNFLGLCEALSEQLNSDCFCGRNTKYKIKTH